MTSKFSNTEGLTMPHREKLAWMTLLLIAATYGPYFVHVAMSPPAPGVLPNLPQLWLLGLAAGGNGVLHILGRIGLRIAAPEDARAPADERDRDIERRSSTAAYYVMMTGMILVGMVMPFTTGGWEIVNAALFAIVLAEITQNGLAAWSYRRSAA
jgi:cytochrome b561